MFDAHSYLPFAIALLGFTVSATSEAQSKPKLSGRVVLETEISSVSVTITEGKKTPSFIIQCLGGVPGRAKSIGKENVRFQTFGQLIKQLKGAKTLKTRLRFKKLGKAGVTACKSGIAQPGLPTNPTNPSEPSTPTDPIPSPGPTPTPIPDQLSLEPYTGPWGEVEARILHNRFAFGGTPADIADSLSRGLDGTLDKLLTVVAEPELTAQVGDIECDSWMKGDPDAGNAERECAADNPNDFSRLGQRLAWIHKMRFSKNGFFERFAFFLHDERLSVAQAAARDCEKHALRTYMNDVYAAATSGNYLTYMRAMNNSQLMHLRWLDGASNQGGVVQNRPNENYAREFWELGTVGPTALDGTPVYSDFDIAQSSVAFTGWTINEVTIGNNIRVCVAAKSPLLHTPGLKTIFGGTPWEARVDTDEDVLNATFAHPRTSEHLAEDIWKQFINYSATPDAIRQLAKLIRDNNYNLLPVFRTVMKSKAVYAQASRNALIKQPTERLVIFLKASGFPMSYRRTDTVLSQLEQLVLNPNSVFGWDEKKLAADAMLLAWRNTVTNEFININVKTVKEKTGWSFYDRFVLDLFQQGRNSSLDVIDRVARDLGQSLNDKQRTALEQLINFDATTSGCPSQCNGGTYRLVRDRYDMDPSSVESGTEWNGQRQIRKLLTVLLTNRDYLLK